MVLRDKDATGDGTYEQRLYVQHDANFNTTAITNASGTVQQRFVEDAYGSPTYLTASWGSGSSTAFNWIYIHQGLRLENGGLGLYDMRTRAYSPTLGRPMQMDSAGYADGMNGYQAYRSNPLSFLDPMGTTSGHLGGMQGSGGITLLPWYPGLDFPPPELLPHFMPPDGGLPTPSAIISDPPSAINSDPPPPQEQQPPRHDGDIILFQAGGATPTAPGLPVAVANLVSKANAAARVGNVSEAIKLIKQARDLLAIVWGEDAARAWAVAKIAAITSPVVVAATATPTGDDQKKLDYGKPRPPLIPRDPRDPRYTWMVVALSALGFLIPQVMNELGWDPLQIKDAIQDAVVDAVNAVKNAIRKRSTTTRPS